MRMFFPSAVEVVYSYHRQTRSSLQFELIVLTSALSRMKAGVLSVGRHVFVHINSFADSFW
jgi:hypothetical protein